MQVYKIFPLLLSSYLLGSIPIAFIVARMIKGIDIRHYGSGTVSASMVFEHVDRWTILPIGILDILKVALPTHLALRWGFGQGGAAAAGLAAMIGHNWPIFLKFTGGRGISSMLGIFLVLFPWGCVWLLAFLGIGYLLKDSAPWALASMVSMPLLIGLLGGSCILYELVGALLVIVLVKRLEANRRPLPAAGEERRRTIWMRLIYDRDMMDHYAWIHRRI